MSKSSKRPLPASDDGVRERRRGGGTDGDTAAAAVGDDALLDNDREDPWLEDSYLLRQRRSLDVILHKDSLLEVETDASFGVGTWRGWISQ